jgi:hypothetical protein
MTSEDIMKKCMESNTYGENSGSGYTGVPISKCRKCDAKKECSMENWIRAGGRV